MKLEDFTENAEVKEIIRRLNSNPRIYSDVIDSNGNQYVDLVQEGGGVLGVALLGYTYVLEKAGIRFFSLAGTSAGAINTMLLASADFTENPKTEKVLEILANKNLLDFVDGPFYVRALIKMIKSKPQKQKYVNMVVTVLKVFGALFLAFPSVFYLIKYKGLNPGKNFEKWISEQLRNNGISSTAELRLRRRKPAGLKLRDNVAGGTDDLNPKIKIIVAELTTETRVIFPEMDHLFWDDPDSIDPCSYVRASMSIPLFFHPLMVKRGKASLDAWRNLVKFYGDELPEKFCFVDGGILSNFPIDVFHNLARVPRLPTFGVKLGDDRNEVNSVGTVTKLLFSMFNSARHVLDFQFVLRNPDYEHLIQKINTGDHNWLNFSITDEEKLDLFLRGARAAEEFLTKFDWSGYKVLRQVMMSQEIAVTSTINKLKMGREPAEYV